MSEMIQETQEAQEEQRWVVDNDRKAEWCMEKIAEKREELKKWKDHYKKLSADIEATITADIAGLEEKLKGYFFQMSEGGFTRSTETQEIYNLPHGKIFMAHQEPEYDRDNAVLLDWLKKNSPEFVKVEETVKWGDLKKTLGTSGTVMTTEDGEIVPGITVNTRPAIFKVEVK